MNNGYLTSWFKPLRGVRQGCPLSPYLFILTVEILSNNIRQDTNRKGIVIFGNEIKLTQFADDTNLFCRDLDSVSAVLNKVNIFSKFSGLHLNIGKTKAMWLGRWSNNKTRPLEMKWVREPTKILGIHVSYNEKGNDQLNFKLKIQKMQSKLDIWNSRALTLYGKVLIAKSLGLSALIYSASIVNVPTDIPANVTSRLFKFLWKNKRDKIEPDAVYQEYDKGGLRMIDVDVMFKSLRLAWIPRLLQNTKSNWKTVPEHFFRKCGSLRFLLRCNYHTKYLVGLPKFYRDALSFFSELKSLYNYNYSKENLLFNNQDILIDGKPFFLKEWFLKGVVSVNNLFHESGRYLTFQEFLSKYNCKSNFLEYYQVLSAIPSSMSKKVGEMDNTSVEGFVQGFCPRG